MKNQLIVIGAIFVSLAVGLSGCNDLMSGINDNSGGVTYKNDLIGTWKGVENTESGYNEITYVFDEDGEKLESFVLHYDEYNNLWDKSHEKWYYEITGNVVHLIHNDRELGSFKYTLSDNGNTLTVVFSFGTGIFHRVE